MEEMRQLISKRSGDLTPRSQHRGPKEAATAGSDAARTEDFLRSMDDAISDADKSLVRAASSQEALSVDVGLLVADLTEVSLVSISRIKSPIFFHRKPVSLKSVAWSSRAPSGNVNW